jgi:GDP-L-fucose synthase
MKVLVTGGHGFVGKHLVAYLRDNTEHELFVPLKEDGSNECWKRARQLDTFCMNPFMLDSFSNLCKNVGFDAIVHLAGVVGGIGFNVNNQGKLLYHNLQMGMNVLTVAKENNIPKVIMLGTTCSYPCVPKTIPFIEDELFDGMPELTNSGYGIAKRTLVKMGMEYSKQYGMKVVNLIPTNMFGEHDHFEEEKSHVIPALIKKFESARFDSSRPGGVVNVWGTGSASRDFLYVGDCVRAIATALEKDIGPEPINLGTGRETTIKSLTETINKMGLYNAEIIWDNTKPDGQPRRCLDTTRAKEVLRWEATTPLDEAIESTILWYRNNK